MEEFKNYFKFPLKMWEFMDIKVFTDNDKMAFDWLCSISREVKLNLIARINGEKTEPYKTKKEFWSDNGIVSVRILEGNNAGKVLKLFRVRGWGMLTGVGGYQLPADRATEIQDAFTDYCVTMLNNGNQ